LQTVYPVYRKYSNNKSYFKVLGPALFEEVQIIGRYYTEHLYEAKILPDRNFIADMIAMEGGAWEEVTADEYMNFVDKCRKDFKKPA